MTNRSKKDFLEKLSNITPVPTVHNSGKKYVFRTNSDLKNACTQIAYGVFEPGEICEAHTHPTMFEYFFFIKGKGSYIIDEEKYDINEHTFLEIPAGYKHSLHADKNERLEFIYWGVATDLD